MATIKQGKSVNTSLTVKDNSSNTLSTTELNDLTSAIKANTEATNLLLKNANTQYNISNKANSTTEAKPKDSKESINKIKEELALAQKERAEILRDQAAFSFELAKRNAAKRAEDTAKAELEKEQEAKQNLYKDNPLYKAAGAIGEAQGGFGTSTMLSMATGGLLNPAVINALGIDKIANAGLGFIGKTAGNLIQSPFKKYSDNKKKEQTKQKAISDAVEKAQLNKEIEEALAARGLSQRTNDATKTSKTSGKSSSAAKENPNERVEGKLDTINKTLEKNGKAEKKEEKKEEDGLFSKLFGFIGMIGAAVMSAFKTGVGTLFSGVKAVGGLLGHGLMGLLSKVPGLIFSGVKAIPKLIGFGVKGLVTAIKSVPALLKGALGFLKTIGPIIMKGVVAAGPALAGAIAFAVGGLIGKYLADKAVDHVSKNTNLLGDQSAKHAMSATSQVNGNQDIVAYQKRTGDFAGFTKMKQYMQLTETEEQGLLWGKNEKKVAERKRNLGNIAKDALELHDPEIVKSIEAKIKENNLSEADGWDLYIETANKYANETLKSNIGRPLAEIEAEQKAKLEAKHGNTEKKAEQPNIGGADRRVEQTSIGNTEKKELSYENKMEKLAKLVADGELTHEQAEQIKEEMNISNKDLTKKQPTVVDNYSKIQTDDIVSEDTMNSMIAARQNASQMNQMSQTISNNGNNDNSSNIYQTNITQYKETGVYATGDVARTMLTD